MSLETIDHKKLIETIKENLSKPKPNINPKEINYELLLKYLKTADQNECPIFYNDRKSG